MEYGLAIVYNSKSPQQPISDAGQVWNDIEHPQWGAIDPIYIDVEAENNRAALQDFMQVANVTKLPAIVFIKKSEGQQGQTIVTRITQGLSYNKIKAVALAILNGKFTGEADKEPSGDDYKSYGLPFGGSLLNIKIPRLAWIALAVWSGKQFLDTDNTVGRVGYGALTAYSIKRAKKK